MGETTNEVMPGVDSKRSDTKAVSADSSSHIHEPADDSNQQAGQIRSGIEQTRSNLSATIDALQDKLDPSRIAEQVKDQIREKASEAFDNAKSAVKEATIGKAEKIMSSVSETVTDLSGRAGTAVSDTSSSAVQYIRDNPVPFALFGLGLGLLAMNKRRSQPSAYNASSNPDTSVADRARGMASGVAESARGAVASVTDNARAAAERTASAVSSAASSVRDATSNAADTTRQQLHDVSDRARQGAQVAGERLRGTLQDNPMALGIAALAAGALVGLTLPGTSVEAEYMGDARDRFVGQAKSVAQDVVGKVQRVTEEAGETAKNVAQKEGLVAG